MCLSFSASPAKAVASVTVSWRMCMPVTVSLSVPVYLSCINPIYQLQKWGVPLCWGLNHLISAGDESKRVREIFIMTGSFSLHVKSPRLPHFRKGIHLIFLLPLTALCCHWAVALTPTVAPNNASSLPSMRDLCFGLVNHALSLPRGALLPPSSPPGNNGVHGSVVSANTPSIMTLYCIILSALTQHVMC